MRILSSARLVCFFSEYYDWDHSRRQILIILGLLLGRFWLYASTWMGSAGRDDLGNLFESLTIAFCVYVYPHCFYLTLPYLPTA